MAKYNNQKAKILFLQQMLSETGENRAISMQEILDYLSERGIRAERKSIYDDLEALRYFGMDIEYKRERPSGYYLKGRKVENVPKIDLDHKTESKNTKKAEYNFKADYEDTKQTEKQMKLLCTPLGEKEAKKFFGKNCQIKKRDDGTSVVTAPLLDTNEFYGWLTAKNNNIHLIKPKKSAQAYREYLKAIAKSYKN